MHIYMLYSADCSSIIELKGGVDLAIRYKGNLLQRLKAAGYNTGRIRREKIMGEAVLQMIRHGELVSWKQIDTMCRLMHCQPGDLLEWVPDDLLQNEEDEQI